MTQNNDVIIIGAGPAGLVSATQAIQQGLNPIILEKQNDLGGLWNTETGGTWNQLITNLSKFTCQFSEFSHDQEVSLFPTVNEMYKYLKNYAIKFGLKIIYNAKVTNISKNTQNQENTEYLIEWEQSEKEGSQVQKIKKGVKNIIIATGIFSKPLFPSQFKNQINKYNQQNQSLKQQNGKKIQILHSNDFKYLKNIENKHILVVGGSLSGIEIAAEASNISDKVMHCFNNKFWLLARQMYCSDVQQELEPLCMKLSMGKFEQKFYEQNNSENSNFQYTQLFNDFQEKNPSKNEMDFKQQQILQGINMKNQFLHKFITQTNKIHYEEFKEQYDQILPSEDEFDRPYNIGISDQYLQNLKKGKIIPFQGQLQSFDTDTKQVILNKNSLFLQKEEAQILQDVDIIIFCTGYVPNLDFFDKQILEKDLQYDENDRFLPIILHKNILTPKLKNIYFVGMYKGPYFATMKEQARLICQIIARKLQKTQKGQKLIFDQYLQDIEKEEILKEEQDLRKMLPRTQFPRSDMYGYTLFFAEMGGNSKILWEEQKSVLKSYSQYKNNLVRENEQKTEI